MQHSTSCAEWRTRLRCMAGSRWQFVVTPPKQLAEARPPFLPQQGSEFKGNPAPAPAGSQSPSCICTSGPPACLSTLPRMHKRCSAPALQLLKTRPPGSGGAGACSACLLRAPAVYIGGRRKCVEEGGIVAGQDCWACEMRRAPRVGGAVRSQRVGAWL